MGGTWISARNALVLTHRMQSAHNDTGERMFTITGTAKANESALFLLYENLEAEKMRRSQAQAQD